MQWLDNGHLSATKIEFLKPLFGPSMSLGLHVSDDLYGIYPLIISQLSPMSIALKVYPDRSREET